MLPTKEQNINKPLTQAQQISSTSKLSISLKAEPGRRFLVKGIVKLKSWGTKGQVVSRGGSRREALLTDQIQQRC